MITKPDTSKMEYRYLGNSGLRVSVFGWGNWVNNQDDKLTLDSIKICLENGVNFFDTAEGYGFGTGELTLGKALKELNVEREKVVISTKLFKIGNDPNDSALSRKHVLEGLKNSLKRLQLDYVDIVFCHRPDRQTPIEETCKAMNNLIDLGLAFYWGTSEWESDLIMEAYKVCEELKLIPPICEQCNYNMFVRERVEDEYRDLFKKYKMGTTIWSPLFSGILTGKYIKEIPKDSRFNNNNDGGSNSFKKYMDNKKEYDAKLIKLKEIAEKKLNCTLAQLALAWVIVNPDTSTCLLGASKTNQLEENFKAFEVYKKLDKNILLEIEKTLNNTPRGEIDYRDWKELPSRRTILLDVDYYKGGSN